MMIYTICDILSAAAAVAAVVVLLCSVSICSLLGCLSNVDTQLFTIDSSQ